MIVYIDQIFIINFITDYIILHISATFTRKRRFKYTVFASLFGGAYSAFMYVPAVSILYTLPFRLLFSVIMIAISERPKNLRSFIKSIMCFSAVSMFLGGGVFAVLFMAGFGFSDILNNSIPIFDAKTPILLLVFCIMSFICHTALTVFFKTGKINSKTVNLLIVYGNKKIRLKGLVDTGCTLYEPTRNRPVIIVDYRKLGDFSKNCNNICMVPYSTVDSSGTFIGFYPDYVKVENKLVKNVAVAVCYTKALDEKQYSAILNSDIFKEENCVA